MANDNPQVNEQIPRTKSQKNDFLIFFSKDKQKNQPLLRTKYIYLIMKRRKHKEVEIQKLELKR